MGNFLSGRRANKVTVERGLKLELGWLLARRAIVPGSCRNGSMSWSYAETGEACDSLGFVADLTNPDDAFVQLRYSANGTTLDYRVRLVRSQCRFGGFRWWWICPRTGHRASKLYLPPGAKTFACRRAFRMSYRSERGGPIDRSHHRQACIFKKLGGQYRFYEQCPPKRPKGMHRRTYERLLAELGAAADTHERIFIAGAIRLTTKAASLGIETSRL